MIDTESERRRRRPDPSVELLQRAPPVQAFLSVVLVLRNEATNLTETLSHAIASVDPLVSDFEIVVIDNASNDPSLSVLKRLADEDGLPNLQVYALTKEVDNDTATWVGLENALGDFIAVVDPFMDDVAFLEAMLEQAAGGADVVFARNRRRPARSFVYRAISGAFFVAFKRLCGIDLRSEAPHYRLLNRQVVNFVLRQPQPSTSYRHLPATGGFSRTVLEYEFEPRRVSEEHLAENVDLGMRMLVSTTRIPMRIVTSLSLFGAFANVVYSAYVVLIWIFKSDVAPGWVSLSLQQSGMFFLISMVLLVLGEYILQMAGLANEGPRYHVAKEFTSAKLTRKAKLNVEEAGDLCQEVRALGRHSGRRQR